MPFPILGAGVFAGVISGLTAFFASRSASIVAGLGLSFIIAKGLTNITLVIVGDISTVIGWLQSSGGTSVFGVSSGYLGNYVWAMLGYAGFFEALNIMISGMLTVLSYISMKVIVARVTA